MFNCKIIMFYDGSGCLTNGFFFRQPNIVEADFSNKGVAFLPLSISQCSLLSRVNLTGTLLSRPPIVLFAIPWLRSHPERIVFGTGQKCSRELVERVFASAGDYGQCETTFVDWNGEKRMISFSPEISARELVCLLAGPAAVFIDSLMLVRTVVVGGKQHVLRIRPGDEPAVVYFYPECVFSLAFRFVPEDFAAVPEGVALFKQYAKEFGADVADALRCAEDVDVAGIEKLRSRSFVGRTVTGCEVNFRVSAESVCVEDGTAKFEVDPESVYFDRQNGRLWLYLGDHKYEIDELSPGSVTEMLAYVWQPFVREVQTKTHDFCDLAGRAIEQSQWELISSSEAMSNVDPENIDKDLESRRRYCGRLFNFVRRD